MRNFNEDIDDDIVIKLSKNDIKDLLKDGVLYFAPDKSLHLAQLDNGDFDIWYNYKGISYFRPQSIVLSDFERLDESEFIDESKRNEGKFFKRELTPLPKKFACFNAGDKVKVNGVEGEIISVQPMRFSDTCTYKIKLDNGRQVERYEEEIDTINESRRQVKMNKRYRNETNEEKTYYLYAGFGEIYLTDHKLTAPYMYQAENTDLNELINDNISDIDDEDNLVNPDAEFSVEDYIIFDKNIIDDIEKTDLFGIYAYGYKYDDDDYETEDEKLNNYNFYDLSEYYEISNESRQRRNEEHRKELIMVKRITGDDYRPGKPKEGFVVDYIEDDEIGLRKYFTNEDDARNFVENELNAEFKLKGYNESQKRRNEDFDPLFKEGNIVTLGITDDEDLNDFLDELGNPEIVITSIEDDYFWGETLDGQNIEYHMEYRDISSIRPGKNSNESQKRRNELSTDLKQRYYDKRKVQADKANKALNRASKLMAKSGIGIPDEIKVTFTYGDCETEEDDYENGALGKSGSSWDNNKPKTFTLNLKSSDFVDKLVDEMGDYLYCYWVTKDGIRARIDGDDMYLHFSVMGDENNEEPSESQFDAWKKGEERLWIIDGYINLDISETDKPYFIKALEDNGIEVEEF